MDVLWSILDSSIYTLSILLVTLYISWMVYDKVITRNISLKQALFEKDNFAAWLTFVGSFILPVFFVIYVATGEHRRFTFLDYWLRSLLVVVSCLTVLFITYAAAAAIIRKIGRKKGFNIYSEIYEEGNTAVSILLAFITVVIIDVLVILLRSLNGGATIAQLISLIIALPWSWIIYIMIAGSRNGVLNELFINNNVALSISFISYMGCSIFMAQVCVGFFPQIQLNNLVLLVVSILLVFSGLIIIAKGIFEAVLKVNMNIEILTQKNLGASFGMVSLFFGVALSLSKALSVLL